MPGKRALVLALGLGALLSGRAIDAQDKTYTVRGMVVSVDPAARSFAVSHERIEGFMEAMTMPFEVRDAARFTVARSATGAGDLTQG